MGINPKDYNDKLAHIEKSLGKDDVDLEAIKSDFKTKLGLDIAGMRFKQAIVKTDGNTVNYWYPVTNSDVKFSNKKDKETLLKKARFLLGVSQVYEKAIAAQTAPHLPKDSESQLTFYKNRKTDFEYLNPPASKVSVESNAWNGDVQEVFFKIIGFGGNYNPKPDNSKSDLGKKTDSAKPATDINPTVPKNPSASTDLAKGKDPVTKTETAPATSSRGVKPASEPTKPLKSSDLGVTGTKPTPEAEIKTETESAISASGVKPASEPIIPPKSDHTGEISEDTTTKTSKDVELTPAEPTSENKTKPIIITKPSNLGATRTNPKPEADKKTEPAKITGKDDSATSIKTAVGTEIKPLNNPSAISTDSETKIEKKIEPTTISEDKPVSNPQISPKPILESASETDVEAKDLDDLDKDLEDLSKLFPHDVKTGASEIKQNPADELSSTPPKNPTASSIDSETKIEKKIEQTKVESTPPPKNPKSGNSFFSGVKSLFGSFGNSSNNKKDSSATTATTPNTPAPSAQTRTTSKFENKGILPKSESSSTPSSSDVKESKTAETPTPTKLQSGSVSTTKVDQVISDDKKPNSGTPPSDARTASKPTTPKVETVDKKSPITTPPINLTAPNSGASKKVNIGAPEVKKGEVVTSSKPSPVEPKPTSKETSLDEKRKKRDQIQNEMNEKFKRVNKSTESLDVPDSATTPLDAKAALKKDETSKDLSSAEPIPTAPVKDEKSTPNLTPGNSSTLEEQKKETASINRKLSSSYKKEQRNKTFYNTNPKDRVKAEPKMVETPSIDSTETKKPKFETVEEFITSTTKNENEKKAEFKEDMISQPTETSKTEKAKESIEESSEFEPGFLSKNDTEEDEYKWDDRDPKPGIVARRRIEQRNAQRGDDSIVKPKVQEGPVKDSVKVGDIDTTSDKPGVESKTTQPRPFQKQPERSQFSFSALPNDRQKKFSFGPTVKESSIQFDIYEGYKEIALEDAKKSNNKLSKIIVSAELAPQLLYQEINEGPNSAVVSFLLSLINKMTPEEFLNELNYYKILPPLTGLSKNDIADFIEISEKAITTFKNVRRNGLLNRDSAITLSIWLRNRLVIEYAKQSTNKASVNDLSSTDKANKEYASKALGYKPDANTNFANAITNFNNPITPDHLLQLGSIFKHPVVVIDLDNEKAALPQVDSPNNIYMIKTKGDSEEKEHYAALMDAQKLTEKVSAPKLQSSGRKAEIEESIISSEKTPEAEKVLEGEYEDMPVNVSIGAGEIDTDEIDIESDENKKSLEAKNTTFSIGVGTKQPITLEEAKIKNLELKNINSNLKYQEIEDNSNSAVTAFLMALINKMSSEDFEKELKQNELIKLGVNSNALMVQKDLDGYNIVSNMAVQSFQNVKKSGLINDSDVFTLTKWLRYRIAIEYRMESFKETKDVDFKSLDDSIKAFAKAYYGDERMPRTYDAFTTAIADLDFPITAEHLILLGKIFKHPVVVLESGSKVPQVTDYPSDNIYLIKKEVEFKKYNARAQPGQKLDHYDALIETKKL